MSIPLHLHRLGRIVATIALTLAVTGARADDEYDLYLYAADDDSYTSLDIANLRSLSFVQTREYNADSVRIYVNRVYANLYDGTSTGYDLAGYDAILFATGGLDTAIDDVTADSPIAQSTFTLSGKQLTVGTAGLLRIYTPDGRTVRQASVTSGETLSLQTLPTGMYIINMGAQSTKILVK